MEFNQLVSKAMVVDDDAIVRKAHKVILENIGFIVDEVASGEKALAILNDHTVILMDIDMPGGMDGIETVEKIFRLKDDNKKIFIVGITTHQEPEVKAACFAVGMHMVVDKPIYRSRLVEILKM